jgi:nucleoporin p58/p45
MLTYSWQVVEKDWKDFQRCQRIVENLKLPPGYQIPSAAYGSVYGNAPRLARPAEAGAATEDAYDTDLIGNYFLPLTSDLAKQLEAYASNLAEIEAHMKVIEASAVSQAQRLAATRAGLGTPQQEDTVQELSDTLIGFEQSIKGVAGTVSGCRDGVNELILAGLGGGGARKLF